MAMLNRLAEIRKARGVSAVAIAAAAGVTRQAIYAIEAGTYMPNTAVALRLARALETTVEALFALEGESEATTKELSFESLDEALALEPGEPVQLCRVGKRSMGVAPARFPVWLPLADGVVSQAGQASVAGPLDDENRVLIAGCDPALSLLAAHAGEAGVEVVLAGANSARSLDWLRRGRIDLAGTHFNEPLTGSKTFSAVTFALWEEGFVVARGNPKKIRRVEDLVNPSIRFMNRETGSGSRRLVDSLLARAGMKHSTLNLCGAVASGHLEAAAAVASDTADCCVAARSAARRFGLDFVPLAAERFDLVLHRRDRSRKAIQTLFEVLNRSRFRRQLELLAGYDVSSAGTTVI